jgi:hypothetical protein
MVFAAVRYSGCAVTVGRVELTTWVRYEPGPQIIAALRRAISSIDGGHDRRIRYDDGHNCTRLRAHPMDISLSTSITLSRNGSLVHFVAMVPERSIQCAISREALEIHFWAPAGADEVRLLNAYLDGHKRIAVAMERSGEKRP